MDGLVIHKHKCEDCKDEWRCCAQCSPALERYTFKNLLEWFNQVVPLMTELPFGEMQTCPPCSVRRRYIRKGG